MNHLITCPGCRRPLKLPSAAVGKPGHCPHCKAAFDIPANPDGSPGPVRLRRAIPRLLIYPAFVLLMLGLAGTLVNGYLSALFAFVPGSDLEFARGRVREVRSAELLTAVGRAAQGNWEHAPRAAAGGVAAAQATVGAAEAEEDRQNEALATEWAPGMKPIHFVSTALSVVALLGGWAMLRGRWYPLAVLGCVAAAVNVNHLCCVPGVFAGIWGILVLVRDEGRAYFRRGLAP